MGKVEIFINEEGVLKVVRQNDLRSWLARLRPEGFEHHRVASWANCIALSTSAPEPKFNRVLMVFFFIALSLTLLSLIIFQHPLAHRLYLDGPPVQVYVSHQTWQFVLLMGHRRILLLMFVAAVLAFGVRAKKARKNAAPEPQTISAPVQHV